MKTIIFNRPPGASGRVSRTLRGFGIAVCSALLLGAANLLALPVVDTLTGGPAQNSPPYSGYQDGNTATTAQFDTPIGLAMDSTGEYLFVADFNNNAVRALDLPFNQTFTYVPIPGLTPAGAVNKPVGVVVDAYDNLYVLNQGNGNNGRVVVFDYYGDLVATNNLALTNANAITMDNSGNIYVTAGKTLLRITFTNDFTTSFTTTIATVTNAGANLQGVVVMDSGLIAACDSGRHGIYLINPTNGAISTLTGFNGAGDYTGVNNRGATTNTAKFYQPMGLSKAGSGILIVADYGNNRVKVVNSIGTVTNLYGVSSTYWYTGPGSYPGWWDGTVVVPDMEGDVEARWPNGVLFAPDGTVYVTEDYYHLIRKATGANLPPVPPPPSPPPPPPTILGVLTNYGQVSLTWSATPGATSYNVKRSPNSGGPYTTIVSTSSTNYTDSGLLDGTTYYYVVSAIGAGGEGPNSAEVSATPPLAPVPDPEIGYVDFPYPGYYSVFHPVSSYIAYNDTVIVIKGTPGSGTYYTYGYTNNAADVANPTPASASIPSDYQDGLFPSQLAPYTISQVAPFLTVKAIGAKSDGSPNSAVVKTLFQFVTGNPNINGNNAAQFTISDITVGAHLYYTLDTSDPWPTNGVDLGTVETPTNVWNVGFAISTNTLFKVRAFRDNYQPSAIVSNWFSPLAFVANKISFGFASGEASSVFFGSPGQYFYAPVTLSPLSGASIYSLQFNLTVTNVGPAPALAPGEYFFESMLEKPDVNNPGYFITIPPAMFLTSSTNPQPVVPPTNQVFEYNDGWFQPLIFSDNGLNLLGVGWLERFGKTNLFDTKAQTLIDFSQAHDTLFTPAMGKVVLGGYAFQIPTSAADGQAYQIQIGRPSATSDGIGAPGREVFIDTPTNGSYTAGAINSIKHVTVGQLKYVAGDCAPFGWFNAGDFGNEPTNKIDSSDVMQVFQSAIYGLNYPPPLSDFYDSMDSCGALGAPSPGGYWVPGASITDPATLNLLFDGNDTLINSMAFGNMPKSPFNRLDVCDVYVTFRRSLDPSLTWFRRFWTNGILAAEPIAQAQSLIQAKGATPTPQLQASTAFLTNPPSINFAAADFTAFGGQTLQVPVTAKIFGDYPVRVLMLRLSVEPLDGSPALTSPVQFAPNPALGAPAMSSSTGNGNYAATWLNSAIAGLTGTATLGTLTVTIPADAPSSAAYAIHFDHASASPNGVASFPNQTLTGLILLSDRSSSAYGDGVPDSWRLRYFGTVHNILSQAAADADGDGASNSHEYGAGTDPTDPNAVLRASTDQATALQSQDCVIRWPSVAGKRYLIERSASLYGSNWIPVSTNTGSGTYMEFHDTSGGAVRFYRVHVTP